MDEMIWATRFVDRLGGLLTRKRFTGVLVLAPCRSIHTCCMRVAIDVAFVNKNGEVIESHNSVAPWTLLKNKHAALVLERIATPEPWFKEGEFTHICLGEDKEERETTSCQKEHV